MKRENYDSADFNLCISLPPAIMLRHHAMTIALAKSKPGSSAGDALFKADTVTVKESWRNMYTPLIESAIGVTHSRESDFSVSVTFSFKDNDRECRCVCKASSKGNRDRYSRRKNVTSQFNLSNVKNALNKMDDEEFEK